MQHHGNVGSEPDVINPLRPVTFHTLPTSSDMGPTHSAHLHHFAPIATLQRASASNCRPKAHLLSLSFMYLNAWKQKNILEYVKII